MTVQCSTAQVLDSAVGCSALQGMAVKCREVKHSSVEYRIMQCIEVLLNASVSAVLCSAVMAGAHHHLITCVQTSKDSPMQCSEV